MGLSIYNWVTIVSTLLLSFLILIQTRGASLGAGIGSGGEVNTERRGTDKSVYNLTIIVSAIFAASLLFGVVFA
ncbi:MAG TPA: preprotein translocase subunit SecG [Candidatus Saccharimonadales bacterium]|nr:preprotein translocase subunit SecG [Candidatus Saccharimonadales bacterium]